MKKVKQIIALMIFISIPLWMTAQPPHPNGGWAPNSGGTQNTPVGGSPIGSPIDGGLSILLAMGLVYGAKKVYQVKKQD
jgi:hypothetical protein